MAATANAANLDYCSDHENSTDLGGSHQTPGISLPPQLNSLQQLTLGLSSSSSPVILMSSEIKLDAVIHYSGMEPAFNSNGKTSLVDRGNGIDKVQDSFRSQEEWSISNSLTTAEHRAASDSYSLKRLMFATPLRFSKGHQAAIGAGGKLPLYGNGRREGGPARKSGPVLSGTAYCLSSCSMILLNKIVLSSYDFNAGISLMFYQNLISSAIVVILGFCGAVSVEKLNWKLVKLWMPVNLIFIGMLVSGMYSLRYINIAMVTILKNVTNILTAIGEFYIFHKSQNHKVWTAMFLMIISAISGGITDLAFDATGYAWQILNCILTASYSLTLRLVMDRAKQLTKSGSLNEVSMVLLNNSISLPFAILLILVSNEWHYVINADVVRMPMFWVVATASGLLGLAISFTSMWFLNQTGPTTYRILKQDSHIYYWINIVQGSPQPTQFLQYTVYLLEYFLPRQKCPDGISE
ncbi:hypothetical protein M9H77_05973 [Catharanthus roseus]|uniref:Uncharacterized protein n=1 Tax=Catharanthus roseus TaxID=4058 RepID=A0ACC0BQT1_CATRO|nr:hypothetical protein M9H77_05973 [Catharanthus roseus]